MCGAKFSAFEDLERHMSEIHGGGNGGDTFHECSWCGLQFSSFSDLDGHNCQQQAVMPNAETVGHEEVVQPNFDATLLQVSLTGK